VVRDACHSEPCNGEESGVCLSEMIESIVIQSSDSSARFTISPVTGDSDYFVARIEDSGLRATKRIDVFLAESLVGLFEEMAVNWKGWQGTLGAETIDHDLSLDCKSDSTGHAFATVKLCEQNEHDWVASTTIRIDSGQYANIAQQLKALLSQRHWIS
jgi:hypothetical protein